jgi:NAD(P)H dehydrogenase (quinone)
MSKALVVYYSRSGHTKRMADLIGESIGQHGVEVDVRDVKDVPVETLVGYDAFVVGSPTYYGTMAADIKRLLDESVRFHGRLDGRIGAAFSSSRQIGGGNETTILGILNALMIHGMIVQGDPQDDHYGPVSINAPDERTEKHCARFGARVAELVKRLR